MRPIVCSLTFCLLMFASAAQAAPSTLAGSWSGNGVAKPVDSEPEVVQCRAKYAESIGRTLEFDVTCSHTHGTFQQTGRVVDLGDNKYSGRIYNSQYNVTGDVNIVVSGNRQTISVKSPKGSANVTLTKN